MSAVHPLFNASASLLLDIIDHSEEAVAVVDKAGLVVYANPALAELFGLSPDAILDHPLPVSCEPGLNREIEILPQRPSRRQADRPRLAAVRSLTTRAGGGLRIVFFRDLSERQELKQELRALALKDELTHFYTYRTFVRFAEHQLGLANRMKKQMVLLRIRLPDLPAIESSLGAKMVDSALVDCAELLLRTFRKSDLLGRLGQDEFAVLAINSLGIYQETITARLQENLATFRAREKRPYALTVACRTTWFDPDNPLTVEQLLEIIRPEAVST